MSEEEKEAIEILKTFEFRRKTINYNKITLEDSLSVELVVHLIDKLQKEVDNRIPREIVENKLKELEEKDYILSSRESEISILKDLLNKGQIL